MLGVEEAGDIQIRADVLNDDVRRVAPTADGDVAVGEGKPFECRRVGASNNLDAGAHRMREPRRIQGLRAIEVGANLLGNLLLSLCGAIGELRSQRRSRAGVDAERCRSLRPETKEVVCNLVEHSERIGLSGGRGNGRGLTRTSGQQP